MKPWMLVFITLAGCALGPPDKLCVVYQCAHLQAAHDELNDPAMTARICAAGAMTQECKR